MQRWLEARLRRAQAWMRANQNHLLARLKVWGGRLVFWGCAIVVGLAAVAFALLSDKAGETFVHFAERFPWLPFVLTPAAGAALLWLTREYFPGVQGSGIPQVVAEIRRPKHIASFNTTVTSADQRLAGTLTLRYNGRATDSAYIDPSYIPVTVALKEYVLVNLGLDYKVSGAISVFGRVENLLGEDYEEVFSFVGSGRAAYGGVRLSF